MGLVTGPQLLRYKTVARFTANDPWNQNQPTQFSIEAYARVPAIIKTLPPNSGDKGLTANKVLLFALRSEIDGKERYLPEGLNELWRNKQVSEEQVVRLLKEYEPNRSNGDSIGMPRGRAKSVIMGICWGFCIILTICTVGLQSDQPLSTMIPWAIGVFAASWLFCYVFMLRKYQRQAKQDEWFRQRLGA